MKRVYHICYTCREINKREIGMEGFELLDYEYDTLTQVLKHFLDNYEHYIVSEVREEQ